MTRAIFAIVVVVSVGILAFTLFNRTEADIPAVSAVAGGTAEYGSKCGGGSCDMSACDKSDAKWSSASTKMSAGDKCCPSDKDKCCPDGGKSCNMEDCSVEQLEKCLQKCEGDADCPTECIEKLRQALEEKKKETM